MSGVPQFKNTLYGKRGVRFIDLTGQIFSRLTVLEFVGINKNKRADWLCQCSCGNKKVLEGKLLRSKQIRSCGCLWKESISLSPGQASLNHYYLDYNNGAKKRNLSFELTLQQFIEITSKNCYYCDSFPKQIGEANSQNGVYIGNGIDRVNNNLGYSLENCVPCCKNCNIAKASLSLSNFLSLIKNIYNNLGLKNE